MPGSSTIQRAGRAERLRPTGHNPFTEIADAIDDAPTETLERRPATRNGVLRKRLGREAVSRVAAESRRRLAAYPTLSRELP
jgi:hypothetical protein